jgi:penicillin-insensitive murein endopeptidase
MTIAVLAGTAATAVGAMSVASGAPRASRVTASHMAIGPATIGSLGFGRSIGSPTAGHLLGGMHLAETEYVRVVPADAAGDVRWGLQPLVTMIDRAARAVRRHFPGTVTSVGHLSRQGGGDVQQHRSHESGRDADLGFFVRSSAGRQLLAPHFVAFHGDGTAPSWPGAYFDDAKNWALVAALVGDPDARVTHLFVAAPLRARLLGYAERVGAPASTRVRAAEIMQQPHGTLPHDDHFHVRIACPPGMTGCVENPAPRARAAGLAPASARPRGTEPVHPRVTPAPHRTKAPPPVAAPAAPDAPNGTVHGPPDGDPPAPASLAAPMDDVDG